VNTPVERRQVLRHNPRNAVTRAVERVSDAAGETRIRKELRRPHPSAGSTSDPWAASTQPRHWNYWRREVAVYQYRPLRESLQAAGLDLPQAEVDEQPDAATLWLEDVSGTPGTEFTLVDHVALAQALGRWQAQGPLQVPWGSRRFLRDYSGSQSVPWQLVDDDAAWQRPLVRDTWPAELREGWRRLLAHRRRLLEVMEGLPRTRSHLDVWVSNEFRRPDGSFVLIDWAFTGDGAIGEDLGNHVPDAVLDLFWPADRLAELEAGCFEAYLSGLRQAGWDGSERDVRLGVVASCVKYGWLLPLMLGQATDTDHRAYHQPVESVELYRQRGLALMHLVSWCDEAVQLLS
jgi:hypothetical protein